jgi:hypothetical protein
MLLQPFVTFNGHCVILWAFGIVFLVLVYFTKNNLATLVCLRVIGESTRPPLFLQETLSLLFCAVPLTQKWSTICAEKLNKCFFSLQLPSMTS